MKPKAEPKKVACVPKTLAADEPDLGIIPQPDTELRLCVNKVSGTSVKGWPHTPQAAPPSLPIAVGLQWWVWEGAKPSCHGAASHLGQHPDPAPRRGDAAEMPEEQDTEQGRRAEAQRCRKRGKTRKEVVDFDFRISSYPQRPGVP